MGLHRCTETECPSLGQPSSKSCGCHKTNEEVLQERIDILLDALISVRDMPGPMIDGPTGVHKFLSHSMVVEIVDAALVPARARANLRESSDAGETK